MNRLFLGLGALSAFFSVALGAFAAHGLQSSFPEADLQIFKTAAQYQMYHALALCVLAALPSTRLLKFAAFAFLFGTVVFSGSLYALVLTQVRWLGAITPIGGAGFLVGWILVFLGSLSRK